MKTLHGSKITVLGDPLKLGDKAPDFKLLNNDLKEMTLADFKKDFVLVSVVPSLDTSVCDFQTRNINKELASFKNVDFITVSMDLPFAQKRWCGAAGLEITTLSDFNNASFGKSYGVLISELRLLARAVFVLDRNRKVAYVEYLDEMTNHPNYDKLVKFLKSL